MPPKITLKSTKNSTPPEPRRRKRGNVNDGNNRGAIRPNSKKDQRDKFPDSTIVNIIQQNETDVTSQQGGVSIVAEQNTNIIPCQQPVASKQKPTRHRKQIKSSWASEITKENREHGKAYKGYEVTEEGVIHGVERPERKLGPRCVSNYCRKSKKRNCHDVDEGKRVSLFERFWSDMSWDQKEIYVASLVDVNGTNVKVSEDSRRSDSMKYFLKIDNKRLQVCKKFFMSSLGLNEWMVKNWAKNNTDGIIPAKKIINARRKANRPPCEKALVVQGKKDFLLKFFNDLPKMPSHYCRERTDKQYLEPNFQSLAQLYRYYLICCNELDSRSSESNGHVSESNGANSVISELNGTKSVINESTPISESNGVNAAIEFNGAVNKSISSVHKSNGGAGVVKKSNSASFSYGYFCDLFKDLKLGLFQPKKDRCDTCVSNEHGNIPAEAYDDHILQKNRARKEKDNDKKKAIAGEAHVLVCDAQAVKLAPMNKSGILYYKTKLKNHNFSIYDLKTTDCMNNWWHEADGGMDSSMFTTCVIDFLHQNYNDDLPIIVWSDGCGYQNRNQIHSNALLDYAVRHKKTVQQKFLVKGHTQMEVDNVHALIENKLKGRNIDLPSDYLTVTKEARLTLPLKARVLHHGDFRDYNNPRLFRYNSVRPGNGVGDDKVNDLRMLQYDPNGIISFKTDFDDDLKPLPRKPKKPTLGYDKLEPFYKEELKISAKRYNDLQDLKAVLPKTAHAFYDNLKRELN